MTSRRDIDPAEREGLINFFVDHIDLQDTYLVAKFIEDTERPKGSDYFIRKKFIFAGLGYISLPFDHTSTSGQATLIRFALLEELKKSLLRRPLLRPPSKL